MEGGLGSTRMGSRSSTRHGPASVFQGRVRRWRKSWAPVVPSPTPSASASRVLLYKWTPVALPSTNGTKESTPEEQTPTKPIRFLPVSVVLQQRNEEVRKASEEAEALSRLEQEAEAATNTMDATDGAAVADGAEASEPKQDLSINASAQVEEIGDPETAAHEGVNATESGHQVVEVNARVNTEASREELAASLQDERTAPQEPESTTMDMDKS